MSSSRPLRPCMKPVQGSNTSKRAIAKVKIADQDPVEDSDRFKIDFERFPEGLWEAYKSEEDTVVKPELERLIKGVEAANACSDGVKSIFSRHQTGQPMEDQQFRECKAQAIGVVQKSLGDWTTPEESTLAHTPSAPLTPLQQYVQAEYPEPLSEEDSNVDATLMESSDSASLDVPEQDGSDTNDSEEQEAQVEGSELSGSEVGGSEMDGSEMDGSENDESEGGPEADLCTNLWDTLFRAQFSYHRALCSVQESMRKLEEKSGAELLQRFRKYTEFTAQYKAEIERNSYSAVEAIVSEGLWPGVNCCGYRGNITKCNLDGELPQPIKHTCYPSTLFTSEAAEVLSRRGAALVLHTEAGVAWYSGVKKQRSLGRGNKMKVADHKGKTEYERSDTQGDILEEALNQARIKAAELADSSRASREASMRDWKRDEENAYSTEFPTLAAYKQLLGNANEAMRDLYTISRFLDG